ncbi:hypothetical protein [Azospirillum palustre]
MAETSSRRLPLRVEGARPDLTSALPRLQGRLAGESRMVRRFFRPVAAPYRIAPARIPAPPRVEPAAAANSTLYPSQHYFLQHK